MLVTDAEGHIIKPSDSDYYKTLAPAELGKFARAIKQMESDTSINHSAEYAHNETLEALWITEHDYLYIMEHLNK